MERRRGARNVAPLRFSAPPAETSRVSTSSFRMAALLGAAVALGAFSATLTHHLRVVPAAESGVAALAGVAPFVAGLLWLGIGLTFVLQRPDESAVRWLHGTALAAAFGLFVDAGGAGVLGGRFAVFRDVALGLAGAAAAIFALRVAPAPRRLRDAGAALALVAAVVLPTRLAPLPFLLLALVFAARGREHLPEFTARQQSTWLLAGLGGGLGGLVAAAVLSLVQPGDWARDLAALSSLAIPIGAALSLQKVALLDADRRVGALAVGTGLVCVAVVVTDALHTALAPLPTAQRLLLTSAAGLLLLLTAGALRRPLTERLRDTLFPEGRRLREALRQCVADLLRLPPEPYMRAVAARLGEALGIGAKGSVSLYAVAPDGTLHGFDHRGRALSGRLRPRGALWSLAAAFGAPLSAAELETVAIEPIERFWLEAAGAETAALVPLVFDDRPVGLLHIARTDRTRLADEAWRALSRFADTVADPFAAAHRRAAEAAAATAATRLDALELRLRAARDARSLRRGLQGIAGHLRRAGAADAPPAAEAAQQASVCDVLFDQLAEWDMTFNRHVIRLGDVLEDALLAVTPALLEARIEVDLQDDARDEEVFSDPGPLAVLIRDALDESIARLANFPGPRVLHLSAGAAQDAPGFLGVRILDSAAATLGPPRGRPGNTADDFRIGVLRALSCRRTVNDGAVIIEVPMGLG